MTTSQWGWTGAIIIAYVAVFVTGTAFIAGGPRPAREGEYAVTRTVPVNHRLAGEDVVFAPTRRYELSWSLHDAADFRGRYTTHAYGRGDPIALADTTERAAFVAPPNAFLYWIASEAFGPADRDAVDAGSTVDLCALDRDDRQCFTHLFVAGVACDTAARCSVAVWIPLTKRPLLVRALDTANGHRTLHAFVRRPVYDHRRARNRR